MTTADPTPLAPQLVSAAREAGLRVVTVESCTGGLIANLLTDVPGSSLAFWGGWITYDEEAKTRLVNVPESTLRNFGAVSGEVAQAMAKGGARQVNGPCLAISITGIAGPSGGTADKPVGLAYVGWALRSIDGRTSVGSHELREPPETARVELKQRFAATALRIGLETLRSSSG